MLLSPFLLLIGIVIQSNLGSPVLFTQPRPGKGGRTFALFKFRTMKDAVDRQGNPTDDEERLTPFGQKLRSTSLDELPELMNVFVGEMSMVGPRPLLPEYLPLYNDEQARRHEVRPGITGLAQVRGRNALTWEEKFALDVEYVDDRSILLDLKILFMTVGAVFSRSGISQEGRATMEPFAGTPARVSATQGESGKK